MDKTKDKADILEAMEENQDETRQSCKAWNRQWKCLEMGEQQKGILAGC